MRSSWSRLAASLVLCVAAWGGELRVERVFGPETPTGRYKHPASITQLKNGDLYLVYYGGDGEYAVDTGVFGARLAKGTSAWEQPRRIAHDPFRSVGNAVIWQAPDDVVWLFYVVRYGKTWTTSRIQAKISRDGARSWSDSFVVAQQEGMMVRNRPLVLANGDYLLPVYLERGNDAESVGPESTSRFLRFSAGTREWSESGVVRSSKGNIQPAVAELTPGVLVAYCRRGGGYGPVTDGYLIRSESRDGGRTWSGVVNSPFPNPNAAVDLMKLASGNLLLVFNDCMTGRTPLTAALSTDLDRSWPVRRNIAEGKDAYGYPYAIQTSDGLIHVVYTSEGRTVINHAIFDEDWVRRRP